MLVIKSSDAIDLLEDDELRALMRGRVTALEEFDDLPLEQLVQLIVVQPGDEIQQVNAKLGFQILSTPVEIFEDHTNWYEMVFIVSDDGFGFEVFVSKQPGVPIDLLQLCAHRAEQANTKGPP